MLLLVLVSLGKNGGPNGEVYVKQNYSTWDPRKSVGGANNGQGPMYDEIPYGDGPGPRGPIPELPQHYAQVPKVPQRQGFYNFIFHSNCDTGVWCSLMPRFVVVALKSALKRQKTAISNFILT